MAQIAMEQVYVTALQFSAITVIPSMLNTYIHSSAVNTILLATNSTANLNTKQRRQVRSYMLCNICGIFYVYVFMVQLVMLSRTQIL